MTELKPCPICLSTNVTTGDDLRSDAIVYCCTCGMQTKGYDTPNEAIATWNHRAPDLATQKREEVLRKALEEIGEIYAGMEGNANYLLRA